MYSTFLYIDHFNDVQLSHVKTNACLSIISVQAITSLSIENFKYLFIFLVACCFNIVVELDSCLCLSKEISTKIFQGML